MFVVDAHRFDFSAKSHFVDEIGGCSLLGGEYAVYVEAFEYRLVQLVDGAGEDVLHFEFFQQCDGADACSEIFAYGYNHEVDVFKREHTERHFVGRVDDIGCGNEVFDRFDKRWILVGSDHFVSHIGEVYGEIGSIDAESDYQVAHVWVSL